MYTERRCLIMAKTANLYARIEPGVKEQAESILSALGIPASSAITMFYKQIILHGGLPFDVKLPFPPLDFSTLSKEEIDKELEKGYKQIIENQTLSAEEAFDNLQKKYGI